MTVSHQYCTQCTHWELLVFSIKFLNDRNINSPCVHSFMSSNVNSSSFAVISVNTTWIKTHSWAVSLVCVDSSKSSEKHSQSAMSLRSCYVKSSAITSQCCVTVLLDSWRTLIDDNISGLFLKSRNKESAASTKASFIILALKVEQTKQRINGAPVSQHRGNSTVHINNLAYGGSMHTAGATQETKRSNPSDGAWSGVTAEVQELLRWTPEDPSSNGGAATIQCHHKPGETTAAEESNKGARRWKTLRLWWREDQRSNDGQPTEYWVRRFES